MNSTRRNVGLLAACQALLFTNSATLIAINGLAGLALAPRAALATLPVTCWVVGGAIATMPASLHMKRVERRRGLSAGTLWGIVGALICAGAVWLQSFWLLCFGALVFGVYNAQYYRFAAADVASADYKSTAISLVLWNFLYIGGTALLTETYRPEEMAKAQGANDQAIFIMMAISSFTSGLTVTAAGWERVNLFALPMVAVVALATVWYGVTQRPRRSAA